MKLYAKISSERAKKGQGGNKSLDIDIFIYDRNEPRYQISITPERLIFTERGYGFNLLERKHADLFPNKGKKEKGKCDCGNPLKPDEIWCKDCDHGENCSCPRCSAIS